ncbi:P-loop containing nucleoside triphosphate hydrolase protein [Schizophyllum commune Tattone D]|nr:P-loop containing nucleoside triphosphate hydrolase protein [Schizophyllum commune Tattone D]
MASNAALGRDKLSDEEVRARVQEAFHLSLCFWQIRAIRAVCLAQSSRRDVCLISATGSGKTVTFLAPLLFIPTGFMVIITPLNLLGEQIAAQLKGFGISAVALSAETSTPKVFQQDIRNMKYRVIVTNVEIAKRPRGEFDKLWRDRKWTSRLICIVWDEAHCVSKWADFRAEYKDAGRIRRMLPDHVPFYLVSATLPPAVLADVYHNLGMRASTVDVIHRSNDRPNIHLVVRRMRHPLGSFRDLDFIVTDDGRVPLKFVVFFDSIQESVDAVDYLRTCLRPEDRHRNKWFNSHMTSQFRDDEMDNLASGETWGLACTDSFGLGIDRVRNIELAVQHRVRHIDICKLVQRYGRAMRSNLRTAIAVILAEAKYYDEEREEKEEKKRKKAADEVEKENKKRKGPEVTMPASPAPGASVSRKGAMNAAERAAMLEGRRAVYSAHGVHDVPKKKGRVEKDIPTIDPALDDMVNAAGRGFGCYRLPAQVFFGNDKIGEASWYSTTTSTNRPRSQSRTICSASLTHRRAAHDAQSRRLQSAARFVHPTTLWTLSILPPSVA